MELNVVLLEPEIAANTGNIGRTCAATGARLHLIEPLGFHLTARELKRAGMDYWDSLDVTRYSTWEDFLARNPGASLFFLTTKARRDYTQMQYTPGCYLVFGKESVGNSAAIVMYEALRQNRFDGLSLQGDLHRLSWD